MSLIVAFINCVGSLIYNLSGENTSITTTVNHHYQPLTIVEKNEQTQHNFYFATSLSFPLNVSLTYLDTQG